MLLLGENSDLIPAFFMKLLGMILRYFYNFLTYLLVPLLIIRLLWRSRKNPGYRKRIPERFGFFKYSEGVERPIWIHAVSVGETIAAISLIKALRSKYPNIPIVFTTTTPTGSDRAVAAFGDSVFHVYSPYDIPIVVKHFLAKVRPQLLIIMETEIWPNMLELTHLAHVPILLANARLSEKSLTGYLKLKKMIDAALNNLSLIAAQDSADASRYEMLGMPKESVHVVGNIKFDIALPEDVIEKGKVLKEQLGENRPVFIVSSTHEGEEETILEAFKIIREKIPSALLVLVPRHPERFNSVAELCETKHFSVVLRSENKDCDNNTAVFLGDTMGELLLFYAAADVVFMGGSLVKTGGHNFLEPALFSLPLISGPYLFNFAKIASLLEENNALEIVDNSQELADRVIQFLSDKNLRHEYGKRAHEVLEKNRGSLERHLQLIDKLLH